jgi:Arc/MetJ family transcription regulator
MRVRLTLDDELVTRARALTGLKETSTLVSKALEALIERGAAHRLVRLGGSEPHLRCPPRRRPPQ